MSVDAALGLLAEAECIRLESFPDLYYRGLRSKQPLQLTGQRREVRWFRIAAAKNNPVELEQVSVVDLNVPQAGGVRPMAMTTSSLMPGFEPQLKSLQLFEANEGGLAIATHPGAAEWIAFELPYTLTHFALTIHARDDRWAWRAWTLTVETSVDGQTWEPLYSHAERLAAYQRALAPILVPPSGTTASDEAVRTVGKILTTILQGQNDAARPLLDKSALAETDRRHVKAALNRGLLRQLHLEWTSHGIQRSFRYWSHHEKTDYLRCAKEVVASLKPFSQNVCFGFGFVLGTMRNGDFIPHDDDIDLVLAVPHQPGMRLATLLDALRKHLTSQGYLVAGSHFNHVHVRRNHWPHVFDVFVGFTEGHKVSWFPSARAGLALADVFPARSVVVHGVDCEFPASPVNYLATTYGPDWKEPDSHFMHPWDRSQYKDIG